MNWSAIGAELRQSAMDAHDGHLPALDMAYSFLLENPECFGHEEWPEDMPDDPHVELVVAYYLPEAQ